MPRILSAGVWVSVAAAGFYLIYEQYIAPAYTDLTQNLYRLTNLVAAGGTATLLPAWQVIVGNSSTDFGRALAAADLSRVNILDSQTASAVIQHSGDGGGSFSVTLDTGIVWQGGSEFKRERSTPARQWVFNYLLSASLPSGPSSFTPKMWSTGDGGATWTSAITGPTLSDATHYLAFNLAMAPAEDGASAYLFITQSQETVNPFPQPPTFVITFYVYRFYASGAVTVHGPYAYGYFFNDPNNNWAPSLALTRPGHTETPYVILSNTKLATYDWTTETVTNLTVPWNDTSPTITFYTAFFDASGSLYVVNSLPPGTTPVLYRSDDGGSTWPASVDLNTALNALDANGFDARFLRVDSAGLLVVPFFDGYFGISSDKGATWALTAQIGLNILTDPSTPSIDMLEGF